MFTLESENHAQDTLRYMKFKAECRTHSGDVYDCHIAPEITHFIDVEGVFTIDGRDYEISPGDIFILRSNEKHRISRITRPGTVENINFDPAFLWQSGDAFYLNYMSVFTCQGDFENRLCRENSAHANVARLMSEINDEFVKGDFGYAHMVRMHLFTILLTLVRSFGYKISDSAGVHAPHVDAIRESMRYIDEHLSENLSLPRLAEIASLSTNYYGTLFKTLNGVTPVEYITSKRVLYAISLLSEFKGTMLELALMCGFNNTANFNRAFRMYTGQVPSKYVPPKI